MKSRLLLLEQRAIALEDDPKENLKQGLYKCITE